MSKNQTSIIKELRQRLEKESEFRERLACKTRKLADENSQLKAMVIALRAALKRAQANG